jgi:hypothetical protein
MSSAREPSAADVIDLMKRYPLDASVSTKGCLVLARIVPAAQAAGGGGGGGGGGVGGGGGKAAGFTGTVEVAVKGSGAQGGGGAQDEDGGLSMSIEDALFGDSHPAVSAILAAMRSMPDGEQVRSLSIAALAFTPCFTRYSM